MSKDCVECGTSLNDGWICIGQSLSTEKPFSLRAEFLYADSRGVDNRIGELNREGDNGARLPSARELVQIFEAPAFSTLWGEMVAEASARNESKITFLTSDTDILCRSRVWVWEYDFSSERRKPQGYYFDFRRDAITPTGKVELREDNHAMALFVRDQTL